MKDFNYRTKRQELDEIILKLQENSIDDFDKSINLYEKAKIIINELNEYLEDADKKIKKIKSKSKTKEK